MLFNVPVKPIRALNPSQLCKRTALLQDGYVGRDPRQSRTARGVTALTHKSVAHTKFKQDPPPASFPENGTSSRLRTNLIDQPEAPCWTTIDSPVAGKVVRQSPHPAQFTRTSRSGHSRLTARSTPPC